MDEILDITLHVASVLERLGIPWLVGGSLASSLHGIPRATQDVDLVARLELEDLAAFVNALREDFHLDPETIREAIRQRTSFNLIHLGTLLKVDIFVARADAASLAQMDRRRAFEIGPNPPRRLIVASPEDTIAQKLYWYRLGDEVSDRQWSDAMGVIRVTGSRLDLDYLRQAAAWLGVPDLLERALSEAGPVQPVEDDDTTG
jgi:hypothetical protein